MNRFHLLLTLALTVLVLAPAPALAQSQTETEVAQTIEATYAYSNANLRDGADDYSAQGALEFWSSGGLLQEIPPDSRTGTYDALNIHPKHIRVLPLVEGQVAVAHYYAEGSMTPQGGASVGHYLTRVTQVFVRENGAWKIRSSHWSPIAGGAGTSQAALDE